MIFVMQRKKRHIIVSKSHIKTLKSRLIDFQFRLLSIARRGSHADKHTDFLDKSKFRKNYRHSFADKELQLHIYVLLCICNPCIHETSKVKLKPYQD